MWVFQEVLGGTPYFIPYTDYHILFLSHSSSLDTVCAFLPR